MGDQNCLFCQIARGEAPSVKVWEGDKFVAIENKFPKAPVHILVIPKEHVSKKDLVNGVSDNFWSEMFEAVFTVIRLKGLDKTGYKLVNNGAGYNHFDHEHIHVLGGTNTEPGGQT